MHEIVATRTRCGYRRVYIMLRREGWRLSRNVVYRLYREEGLALRTKRPRRCKMAAHREARCQPPRPNQAWSMDFMADQLGDGGKIRFLTVIDVFTREALAIEVGERLRGEDVATVLNRLVRQRGAPSAMFVDNGAGFTGQIVDLWAYHHKVRMDVSRPGTPTEDAHIESFNGLFRDDGRLLKIVLVRRNEAGQEQETMTRQFAPTVCVTADDHRDVMEHVPMAMMRRSFRTPKQRRQFMWEASDRAIAELSRPTVAVMFDIVSDKNVAVVDD